MHPVKGIRRIPKPAPCNESTMPKIHIDSAKMQIIPKPHTKEVVQGGGKKNLLNFRFVEQGITNQFPFGSSDRTRILEFKKKPKNFPIHAKAEAGPKWELLGGAKLPFPKGVRHEFPPDPEIHTDIDPIR